MMKSNGIYRIRSLFLSPPDFEDEADRIPTNLDDPVAIATQRKEPFKEKRVICISTPH